jgi:ferredoxin
MISVNSKICNGCGACVEVCPTNALSLHHNLAFIDQDLCQGCIVCVDACPQGAILVEESILVKQDVDDLIPANNTQIAAMPNQSYSLSWRDVLVSTLVWTGREIVPRLANLAVNYLERRVQSTPTNQNHQIFSDVGWPSSRQNLTSRRRRQRRRQRQFR